MLRVWFLLQVLTWVYTMRRKYIFMNPEKEERGGEGERERIHFNEEVLERREGIPGIVLKVTCSCSMVQNPRNTA